MSTTLERCDPAVGTVEAVAIGVGVEVWMVNEGADEPGAGVVCAAVVGL